MTVQGAMDGLPLALKHFQGDWENKAVEDIFVVQPYSYFVRIGGKTYQKDAPTLDALAIEGIGQLAAHCRGNYVDERSPLYDGELPSGERINVVLPPCTPFGKPALSLRRSEGAFPDLERLDRDGLWDALKAKEAAGVSTYDRRRDQARTLMEQGDFTSAMKFFMANRWTIAFVGETGSGKTWETKAFIKDIPHTPDERIIIVSDANEMQAIPHPNVVHLLATKDGRIGVEKLIDAALRMGPRWVIVPEIRGAIAFAFIRALFVSPGITSWHARSAENAFDSVATMIREHPAGRSMPEDALRQMLRLFIDVVIHVERRPDGTFRATDIRFGRDLK